MLKIEKTYIKKYMTVLPNYVAASRTNLFPPYLQACIEIPNYVNTKNAIFFSSTFVQVTTFL